MSPPLVDWQRLARLLEVRSFLVKNKQTGCHCVMFEDQNREILDAIRAMLGGIGQDPRQYERYAPRDRQTGEKKFVRKVWRWRINKMLHVWWVLSNVKPFLRGAIRQKVEDAVQILDEKLDRRQEVFSLLTAAQRKDPS